MLGAPSSMSGVSGKSNSSVSVAPSRLSNKSATTATNNNRRNIVNGVVIGSSISNNVNPVNVSGSDGLVNSLFETGKLVEELYNLRIVSDMKDVIIEQQKEDISRLRARNSELRSFQEEEDLLERVEKDNQVNIQHLQKECLEAQTRLALVEEEFKLIKEQKVGMKFTKGSSNIQYPKNYKYIV